MIKINGNSLNINTLINKYQEKSIEREVLNKLFESIEQYKYDSLNILTFELELRKQIVSAAIALNKSDFSFTGFDKSKCNHEYWDRTNNGGFLLKDGAKPNKAIEDIFINGKKYATECATAMMIVYYKALLNVFHEELFNKVFSNIYLMDWDVRELLLKEVATPKKVADILLGDRGYFSNPDVDSSFPEWQGENVIILPHSMYYGHGIGIVTSDKIIHKLNMKRKKNATKSAYFTDSMGRPNFKKLADIYYNFKELRTVLVWKPFPTS